MPFTHLFQSVQWCTGLVARDWDRTSRPHFPLVGDFPSPTESKHLKSTTQQALLHVSNSIQQAAVISIEQTEGQGSDMFDSWFWLVLSVNRVGGFSKVHTTLLTKLHRWVSLQEDQSIFPSINRGLSHRLISCGYRGRGLLVSDLENVSKMFRLRKNYNRQSSIL